MSRKIFFDSEGNEIYDEYLDEIMEEESQKIGAPPKAPAAEAREENLFEEILSIADYLDDVEVSGSGTGQEIMEVVSVLLSNNTAYHFDIKVWRKTED